jgi:hypothetical protein
LAFQALFFSYGESFHNKYYSNTDYTRKAQNSRHFCIRLFCAFNKLKIYISKFRVYGQLDIISTMSVFRRKL